MAKSVLCFPTGETPAETADRLEEEIREGKFDLSPAEQAEKEALLKDGFGSWSKKDFKAFLSAMERNGRKDKATIYREVRDRAFTSTSGGSSRG